MHSAPGPPVMSTISFIRELTTHAPITKSWEETLAETFRDPKSWCGTFAEPFRDPKSLCGTFAEPFRNPKSLRNNLRKHFKNLFNLLGNTRKPKKQISRSNTHILKQIQCITLLLHKQILASLRENIDKWKGDASRSCCASARADALLGDASPCPLPRRRNALI